MVDIFIPVLWICINANCEFMSPSMHFYSETKCRLNVEEQKQYMKDLVRKTGKGKITTLEGTCVETKIQDLKGIV